MKPSMRMIPKRSLLEAGIAEEEDDFEDDSDDADEEEEK